MLVKPTVSRRGEIVRITIGEQESEYERLVFYIRQFIEVKSVQGKSKRTILDYETTLNRFCAYSQNILDAVILKSDILSYFAKIPNSSAAVYNRPYSCLNSFFNWCVRQNHLPYNPIKKAELMKRPDNSEIHAASIEDIQALLSACDKRTFTGFRNWTLITLMVDSGIRTSELTQIVDDDFNSKNKTIVIRQEVSKTRTPRILYLSDSTVTAVSKLIRLKPPDWCDYIFPSRDGNQLEVNEIGREFRHLCNKAKCKVTPYQLRHSFATYAAQSGMNVFLLQQLMGHRYRRRRDDCHYETFGEFLCPPKCH